VSGAPPWITSKGVSNRSAKCQAAASTATIRGEIVIAAATHLIGGKSCLILHHFLRGTLYSRRQTNDFRHAR
jgi:hypothetical protein